MNELTTKQLHDLVERKLHLLTVIKEMSIQQAQHIEHDEVDELLTLLARKNDAMEALQSVQSQMAPFQSQEPSDRAWESELVRSSCRSSLAKCEKLIAELIAMEQAAVQTLANERDLIGNQLRVMQSTANINRAYEINSIAEEDGEPLTSLSIEG